MLRARGLLMPLLVTRTPDEQPLHLYVLQASLDFMGFPGLPIALVLVLLPGFIFYMLSYGIFQARLLDRLLLVSGSSEVAVPEASVAADSEGGQKANSAEA